MPTQRRPPPRPFLGRTLRSQTELSAIRERAREVFADRHCDGHPDNGNNNNNVIGTPNDDYVVLKTNQANATVDLLSGYDTLVLPNTTSNVTVYNTQADACCVWIHNC